MPARLALLAALALLASCQGEEKLAESPPGVSPDKIAAIEARSDTLAERLTRFEEKLEQIVEQQRTLGTRIAALEEGGGADAIEQLRSQLESLDESVVALQRDAGHPTALPPPPAKPTPPAGIGYVTINAVPAASVYIDGALISDKTPLVDYALASGEHRIQVQFEGSKTRSAERNLMVHPNRKMDLFFSP